MQYKKKTNKTKQNKKVTKQGTLQRDSFLKETKDEKKKRNSELKLTMKSRLKS